MIPYRSQIEELVDGLLPEIRDIRQHLHAHPELSLHEASTSRYIRARLGELNMDIHKPCLSTDVVALLRGRSSGRNVTLRADMDALPIHEPALLPYHSLIEGVMHACGHDGHMAMLLAAARVLTAVKDRIAGSVRFVFQPGEEIHAAGKDLVARGILDNPRPDAVIALHSWPGYPAGTIASRPGQFMAAADVYRLIIRGKGGHGSAPWKAVDPVFTAARVITGLSLLPSKKIEAQEPVVISTCSVHGGVSANVIPDDIVLQGSVRYFSRKVGDRIPALIEQSVQAECSWTGAEYEMEYRRPYIPVINDHRVVGQCRRVAEQYLGEGFWQDVQEPVMGSEDFSYYLEKNPGAMFFLGMGEDSPSLHSSAFDFNDEALRSGILFLVFSTIDLLQGSR
ncbi:MAG: amidohydrolase [Nitrospiraceae bacterium]|nr:MAG: amidohydrolase [Nitrospiraceae bacterium]